MFLWDHLEVMHPFDNDMKTYGTLKVQNVKKAEYDAVSDNDLKIRAYLNKTEAVHLQPVVLRKTKK